MTRQFIHSQIQVCLYLSIVRKETAAQGQWLTQMHESYLTCESDKVWYNAGSINVRHCSSFSHKMLTDAKLRQKSEMV